MLGAYFWLCAQGLVLEEVRGPVRLLGIEPGLATCKASDFLTVLSLVLTAEYLNAVWPTASVVPYQDDATGATQRNR